MNNEAFLDESQETVVTAAVTMEVIQILAMKQTDSLRQVD
jgi:hypothetical protein